MKRILITSATLAVGGMEQSVINFAKIFSEKGIKVKIFLISSNEISQDIPKNVDIVIGKNNVSQKYLIPTSLLRLRKLTKKFNPDFVLSFSGRISSFVIISLLGVNKNVIPFHRSNPNTTYGKFISILNKIFYPSCKAIVVQTEIAKKIFSLKYKNKNILVIPNIVRELNLQENVKREKIILNVSRLDNGKGLENLVRIFYNLNDPDWMLYIVGDGSLKIKLEKLINNLKLGEKVKLLGHKKDVDYYLSIASVFAFTSVSEGYPNALLEAMCAGLPCISFDCPTGPSEMIIDGENGFLVPLGDNEQYIEKLTKLINNKELRVTLGTEAKKLIEKNSPKRIGNKLINELSNIV